MRVVTAGRHGRRLVHTQAGGYACAGANVRSHRAEALIKPTKQLLVQTFWGDLYSGMFQASKSKTRAAQNQPRATAPHRMTWTFAMPGRPERGGVHGDPCAGSARVFCARTALFSRRCFVAMFSVVSPTSRPSCAQHGADCCEPPRPPRGKRAVNTPRHPKLSCRSVQRIEPSRHALRGAKPRRRSRDAAAEPGKQCPCPPTWHDCR